MILRFFIYFSVLAPSTLCDLLTPKEKADVLNKHNELRRKEGASNMAKMVWDCDIERKALEHAKKCVYEHSSKPFRKYDDNGDGTSTRHGENLSAYYTTGSTPKSAVKVVEDWYDEKKHYVFNTGHCKKPPCGHYRQVVWHNSYKIGCARVKCYPLKNFSGGNKNAWFDVCQYGPTGNWKGRKPYNKGRRCSTCPRGTYCCSGLCTKNSIRCTRPAKIERCGRRRSR